MKPACTVVLAMLAMACACPAWAAAPATKHPDFTGLWKVADAQLTVKPEDDASVLTDEALRRRRRLATEFDPQRDDPNRFCVPHGMPWIMTSRARDYLVDIYQTPRRVTMLFEGMDWRRLIRLDETQVPEAWTPGTNGYSLARWEGDALRIETDHFRATPPIGPYQRSEQMHVTEYWRLVQHPKSGRALEVTLDVVDPVIYRGHARGYQLFVPAGPGSVLNEYNCTESLFEDHLAERAKQQKQERKDP